MPNKEQNHLCLRGLLNKHSKTRTDSSFFLHYHSIALSWQSLRVCQAVKGAASFSLGEENRWTWNTLAINRKALNFYLTPATSFLTPIQQQNIVSLPKDEKQSIIKEVWFVLQNKKPFINWLYPLLATFTVAKIQ